MWLASRLGKGCAVDLRSEECYINDNVSILFFQSTCGCHHFEKSWSWTDSDMARLALHHLGHAVLSHRISAAHHTVFAGG